MRVPDMSEPSFVATVLHPTDFSAASHHAFSYALALSLRLRSRLTLLHVGPEHADEVAWHRFPAVRKTLTSWGLLAADSPKTDVFDKLALQVKKVALRHHNPRMAIADYLDEHPADLVVMTARESNGLPRWLQQSGAASVVRKRMMMALYVPESATRLVSMQSGRILLRRILLPIAHDPQPRVGIEAAVGAARVLGSMSVAINVLHVGDAADMPTVYLPTDAPCTWHPMYRHGDVVDEILAAARETEADLMVMVTAGSRGITGAFRGSTTEQVVRHTSCPVLAVPAERL